MSDDHSGPMPLDSEHPFSKEEIQRLRKLLRDDDRATWARKQMRVVLPWFVSIVVGAAALIDWVSKHIKWEGP